VMDLRSLKKERNLSNVLVLPETSRLEKNDFKIIRDFSCPFILCGHVPLDLVEVVECRVRGIKGENPPRISGILKAAKTDPVPIFYEFPVLESLETTHMKIGKIDSEHGICEGILIGERNDSPWAIIAPQIFRSAAYLLSGCEATMPHETQKSLGLIDDLGRISGKKSEICKKGFLNTPIVNAYERILFQILVTFSKITNIPIVHKWFYPGNHHMAMCLTHDVDHAISVDEGLDAIANLRAGKIISGTAKTMLAWTALVSNVLHKLHIWKSRDSLRLLPERLINKLMNYNSVWDLDEYLEIEKQYDATSSYYFLMNSTDNDSDYDFQNPLVKEKMKFIERSHCEVGLHSSFESYDNKHRIIEEKTSLEESLGTEVSGVRQHFLRISVPDTWRNQDSAGFTYDSTFGYADETGFRAGTCLPYNPWDSAKKKKLQLLEIPPAIMDRTLFWNRYLALTFEEAFRNCRKLVDIVHNYNGALTLIWHPHSKLMDRKKNQSWSDMYRQILAYSSQYNPWYTDGRKLAEWWNLRKSILLDNASSSESNLKFSVNSPCDYEGFSVRIYVPQNSNKVRLFVNEKQLEEKNAMKNTDFLLLSFGIIQGKNDVEVYL
jgi:hypothetical protein